MDTSTNRHCSESSIASKRLWRGGLVVNTRSLSGILAAASSGYGGWREDSRSCLPIGASMAEPPDGRSEPYDGRLSRTVVRPGKADAFCRDYTCRGKNQEPRSLDSKVEGDRDFEAYRQHHRKDGCESPGRSASERVRGLESDRSGGRARNREGEGSMIHRNLIDAVDRSGGVEATAW